MKKWTLDHLDLLFFVFLQIREPTGISLLEEGKKVRNTTRSNERSFKPSQFYVDTELYFPMCSNGTLTCDVEILDWS